MKKILALLLAMVMVVGLFAACGDSEPEATEAPTATPTEAPTTPAEDPTEEPTEEPTEAPANYVVAGKLQKHENGWNQDIWGVGSYGIFFNMFANDLPYNEDWTVEYYPVDETCYQLIRDGETINLGNPFAGTLVKFNNTEYYVKLDEWLMPDGVYPIVNGDVLVLNGDFVSKDGTWTIHFDPVYMYLNADMVSFKTEPPAAE